MISTIKEAMRLGLMAAVVVASSQVEAQQPFYKGKRLAVMVNGLGATPPEELYIIYRKVHDILAGRGIDVHRAYVGEYATSMEMAGASLTLFRLDDELAALLDHPARTPFFVQG